MLNFDTTNLRTEYAGDPDHGLLWRFAEYEKQEYSEMHEKLESLDRELRRIDEDLAEVFAGESSEKLDDFFADVRTNLSALVVEIVAEWSRESDIKARLSAIQKNR